jgi:hypothetical protein
MLGGGLKDSSLYPTIADTSNQENHKHKLTSFHSTHSSTPSARSPSPPAAWPPWAASKSPTPTSALPAPLSPVSPPPFPSPPSSLTSPLACGWLDVLLYTLTRRTLVFSSAAPAPEDLGLATFGIFDSSTGMFTTIEGGIKLRGYHRKTAASRRQEDLFVRPMPGVITTKTTIEISSRPIRQDEEEIVGEGDGYANSRFETGNTSSEISRSRHASLSGSWQEGEGDKGETASQKRMYKY